MMNETVKWLCGFLSKRKTIPEKDFHSWLKTDLFGSGLIDSMGLIELVTGIESRFSVELTSAHLQDARFRTVEGIAQIIREIKDEK